jgi:hypothetical protein
LDCGRFHCGVWDGEEYAHLKLAPVDHVNVLGLRFLARHLVTLDSEPKNVSEANQRRSAKNKKAAAKLRGEMNPSMG